MNGGSIYKMALCHFEPSARLAPGFVKSMTSTMHFSLRLFFVLLVFVCFSSPARSQIGNLMSFDDRLLHYGIQIGYTQSKFDLDLAGDDAIRQDALGVLSFYTAGFHISVIGDMRLGHYFNLRFLPGITIINRDLNYSWETAFYESHPLIEQKRAVESVYGDLPIELKFRSWRWNNFRPYVTVGASYGFDFASLRKNKNNNNESIIRLNSHDFRYTAGVGVDVFLRYVKFAIEMKMAFGLADLLVPDNEIYTLSIDKMKSRTFLLSFTFEG